VQVYHNNVKWDRNFKKWEGKEWKNEEGGPGVEKGANQKKKECHAIRRQTSWQERLLRQKEVMSLPAPCGRRRWNLLKRKGKRSKSEGKRRRREN